jgi:hypothetical protein
MDIAAVFTLLEANKNPRGIANWGAMQHRGEPLTSFGIGLTQLRKLAKKIGRDHELAQELFQSDTYDAKVIGLLVDEPRKLTREQAESQVEQLGHGMLAHVFSSCDATLAKTPFVAELALAWMRHDDPVRKGCGYGLLYEMSKDKRKGAPNDAFFLEQIQHIAATQAQQESGVRMAMACAVMGVGKRNATLHGPSLALARAMGDIEQDNGCEPFSVIKHLTRPALKKKLGL